MKDKNPRIRKLALERLARVDKENLAEISADIENLLKDGHKGVKSAAEVLVEKLK